MFNKEYEFLQGEKPIKYTMVLSEPVVAGILDDLIDFSYNMAMENLNPYDYKMYSELLIMYHYTDLIKAKTIVEGYRGTYVTYLVKGYLSFFDEDVIPQQVKELMEMGQKIMEKIYFTSVDQIARNRSIRSDKEMIDFITNEDNKMIIEALGNLTKQV